MTQIEGPLSREKLRDLRSIDSTRIRKRKGICVVQGERAIGEAARTGSLIYLVAADGRDPDSVIPGTHEMHSRVPCYSLVPDLFKEISAVKAGTGLLGVARIPPFADRGELETVSGRCLLFYLDGIQEPGNVGALIRTAWALGARGVLLGDGTADPFSQKGVRASAGSVFHIPLYGNAGAQEMADISSWGYTVFTAMKGGRDYRTTSYPDRSVLALGNEGAGLSKWLAESGTAVGIPLAAGADSLNVVVAGGIIAAEMAATMRHGDTEIRGHGE